MTQRATREDTIQSMLPSRVSIFSTISFPSVVQPRIEFCRPLAPPSNKCTYGSIMRSESWLSKNAQKIEYNVHIPFSGIHIMNQVTDNPRSTRTIEKSIRRSLNVEFYRLYRRRNIRISLPLLLPFTFSIFTVHAHPTTQTDPELLPWIFLRRSGSAGVPRRGFPKEISNSLTFVSFPRCARLRRSRLSFFFLCWSVFDFTLFATP